MAAVEELGRQYHHINTFAMQPTKFQLSFWDAVKTALAYKAITNKEAREHRKNFWIYNREEHLHLYTTIRERTLARMQLVHLKRKLRGKQALYKRYRASGLALSVNLFH